MNKRYTAIWPGQPGGYVPVIADEIVATRALRAQQAEAMAKGRTSSQKATKAAAVEKARKHATRDNRLAFVPGESPIQTTQPTKRAKRKGATKPTAST